MPSKLKVAFIFGRWGSRYHGAFDVDHLFEGGRGLTGSENSFFNAARAMAREGHEVIVCCDVAGENEIKTFRPASLDGATVISQPEAHDVPVHLPTDFDAYLAWNEPDLLRFVPKKAARIECHQINDYVFCQSGFHKYVDKFVALSKTHRDHLCKSTPVLKPENFFVVPNSIDLTYYDPKPIRERGKTIAFISSADRGLHRLLEIFPEVRKQIPDAEVHVFYEWIKLYTREKDINNILGVRINYIQSLFEKYGTSGETGVHLHGNVSTKEILRILCKTRVFAYTCEPIAFTESFSVATLDACASGCVPILSDADSLGEIYGDSGAIVIRGKPRDNKEKWTKEIVRALTDDQFAEETSTTVKHFATSFDLNRVEFDWQDVIRKTISEKGAPQ